MLKTFTPEGSEHQLGLSRFGNPSPHHCQVAFMAKWRAVWALAGQPYLVVLSHGYQWSPRPGFHGNVLGTTRGMEEGSGDRGGWGLGSLNPEFQVLTTL